MRTKIAYALSILVVAVVAILVFRTRPQPLRIEDVLAACAEQTGQAGIQIVYPQD